MPTPVKCYQQCRDWQESEAILCPGTLLIVNGI
jgi:hypothetical protein